MNSFEEKAREIVYGAQWTEDKTLLERIAQALQEIHDEQREYIDALEEECRAAVGVFTVGSKVTHTDYSKKNKARLVLRGNK